MCWSKGGARVEHHFILDFGGGLFLFQSWGFGARAGSRLLLWSLELPEHPQLFLQREHLHGAQFDRGAFSCPGWHLGCSLLWSEAAWSFLCVLERKTPKLQEVLSSSCVGTLQGGNRLVCTRDRGLKDLILQENAKLLANIITIPERSVGALWYFVSALIHAEWGKFCKDSFHF